MKNFQPLLVALALALPVVVFSSLFLPGILSQSTGAGSHASAALALASGEMQAELLPFRNCPCPSEQEDVGCNLDLCGSGILNGKQPERSLLAAIPHPLPAEDLTGIAREPERSPPRSYV